jgi:spermidine/putrescine transport system permease protein
MSARAIGNDGGRWWLSAYVIVYIVFLYLPVALIPLFSFNNSIQAAFPLMGFTFEWYRTLAGDEALQNALLNSLIVGFSAATIATLCGITTAYMDVFVRTPLASVISAIARLPILIPGIIIGIALLILVNLGGIGPSRLAIIAGHILAGLPTTVVIMRGRFAAIPRTIPEAAEDLGAREARIFFRILLPLSLPAIGSAFMLAFLTSFDEFIIAFFLSGTEQTLPIYIWSQLRFPKSLPIVMALGTVILATSVVIVAIAEWLRQRGLSAKAK